MSSCVLRSSRAMENCPIVTSRRLLSPSRTSCSSKQPRMASGMTGGDGGQAIAIADLLHARAEDHRVDDLDDGLRHVSGLDGLLAEAADAAPARETARARLAAEHDEPLREDGESCDRRRAAASGGRIGDDAVVEREVDRVVARGIGDGLNVDADVQQLNIACLCADRAVERLLRRDR